MIAVVPPHGDLDGDAVLFLDQVDRRSNERRLGAIEIAHELGEAALVVELDRDGLGMAQILEDDAYAGIEEGELAQAMLERLEIELDHGEGRRPAGRT